MTLTMIKESSVLSSITVAELTYQGLVVQGNTFAPFEVFAVVAGAYWIISIAVARAATLLERKAGGAQSKAVTRNSLADSFLSLERRPAS
jgi:polar amino acid transport system permease protein